MGTISLYKLKSRDANGWGSDWGTISGYAWACNYYGCYSVIATQMYLQSSTAMYGCSISASFANVQGGTHSARINCYLYSNPPSDPTASAPSSPPSGYIKKVSQVASLNQNSATRVTFTFEDLNFTNINPSTGGAYVFFWFEVESNGTYIDGMYFTAYSGGPSGISAPSVSATFELPTMELTVSPKSLTTNNYINVSLSNGTGSEQLQILYGNTVLYTHTIPTTGLQILCNKSWFTTAGVSSSTEMSLTVKVTGGRPDPITTYITLKAGSDMYPTLGNPTAEIVQGESAASAFPNTYIAGISSCKVSASVSRPTNATIVSVVLSYPGGESVNMRLNSSTNKYEGTTAVPLTADTTFTVTVTDSRGLKTAKTVSVTGVVAYTRPSLNFNTANTYRCNSSGTKESGGAYYKFGISATFSTALSGNKLTVKYKLETEASYTTLASNVTTSPYTNTTGALGGSLSVNSSYTIVVVIEDLISGEITKTITLEGALRNIVVKRSEDGTYVGIGKTPETASGESMIEMPAGSGMLIGGLDPFAFLASANGANATGALFNQNFLSIGSGRYSEEHQSVFFYKPAADTAWSNIPAAMSGVAWQGFRLVLYYNANLYMVIIIELRPTVGRLWFNRYYSNAWSGWKSLTPA